MTDITFSPTRYQLALQKFAGTKKGKESLEELDRWYRNDLRTTIQARDEKYITKEELVKVVKWKLCRGTWRPRLLGYAEAHSEEKVIAVTKQAFTSAGDVGAAMSTLMTLKGMGTATSSAVLAAADPSIPFLSDVMLMVACGSKQYTLTTFLKVYNHVSEHVSSKMTAEEYECALFTKHHLPDENVYHVSSNKRRALQISTPKMKKRR